MARLGRGACCGGGGDGVEQSTLRALREGGDNLGYVAPPRARLTYGLEGTSENDGPGATVTTPRQHSPSAVARPHFHPLWVYFPFMTTHFSVWVKFSSLGREDTSARHATPCRPSASWGRA